MQKGPPQNVVARRESPVINAEASGAEKRLLCVVPGKTVTPRRLVSRIRLRHAMAAGLFHPPPSDKRSHARLLRLGWGRRPRERDRAPIGGDRSPSNPDFGGASRRCCKTELAAPASGASAELPAGPRPTCRSYRDGDLRRGPAGRTLGSGGGSNSRPIRTPAQGGKYGLRRKFGVARGRPQTSDLPSSGFRETTFGRAEPPIPEGFRGSRGS